MIQLAIHEAINGRDLDYAIARTTMEEMMDGTATDIEMATLLTALRMKGETITEITACAEVMREKGAHIEPKGAVMDIVGTGGDEVGSFNISTTAAFVAAAGGVPVAKHGNRSVSSQSGAADVLEELGVVLSLSPEQNERVLAETGICFLFAQGYHKSMKNVAPVRKGMGERTIFNVLGPLSNPARATMQLLGVYDESLVMPMAQVLSNLGVTRGMVVWTRPASSAGTRSARSATANSRRMSSTRPNTVCPCARWTTCAAAHPRQTHRSPATFSPVRSRAQSARRFC